MSNKYFRCSFLLWLLCCVPVTWANPSPVATKATIKEPEVNKKLRVVTPQAKIKEPEVKKKLRVVTTLSVLAALTKEVGGDLVEVNALSGATEDPHFVKAKPTFKRLVGEADLFIEIGRSLELWVPLVISSSGNAKLSGSGLVKASAGVKELEIPSQLTRGQGDIHPEGNPHVWLSPTAALKMAENIKNALVAHDLPHKAQYEARFLNFKKNLAESLFGKELVKPSTVDFLFRLHDGNKLTEYLNKQKKTVGGWLNLAQKIDYPFITYHTVWSYMADEFKFKIFGQIEEKSGVAPSLKYQIDLVKRAKAAHVTHVVAASYYMGSAKLIELIAQQIGGKKLFIDVDCRASESYIGMIDRILKQLVEFKAIVSTVQPIKK